MTTPLFSPYPLPSRALTLDSQLCFVVDLLIIAVSSSSPYLSSNIYLSSPQQPPGSLEAQPDPLAALLPYILLPLCLA